MTKRHPVPSVVSSHEGPVRADNEVWFAVLVDEPGGGLQPLPGAIARLEAVGDHPASARFQNWRSTVSGVSGKMTH